MNKCPWYSTPVMPEKRSSTQHPVGERPYEAFACSRLVICFRSCTQKSCPFVMVFAASCQHQSVWIDGAAGRDSRLDAHGALDFAGAELSCSFHGSDLSSLDLDQHPCVVRPSGDGGRSYQQLRTRPPDSLPKRPSASVQSNRPERVACAREPRESARFAAHLSDQVTSPLRHDHFPALLVTRHDLLIFRNSFVSPALYSPTGTCCSSTGPAPSTSLALSP